MLVHNSLARFTTNKTITTKTIIPTNVAAPTIKPMCAPLIEDDPVENDDGFVIVSVEIENGFVVTEIVDILGLTGQVREWLRSACIVNASLTQCNTLITYHCLWEIPKYILNVELV